MAQSHEPRRVRFRLGELVISGVGLTAIFNLPYFTRELGMRYFGRVLLWFTLCATDWGSHLTFFFGSLDGNRL